MPFNYVPEPGLGRAEMICPVISNVDVGLCLLSFIFKECGSGEGYAWFKGILSENCHKTIFSQFVKKNFFLGAAISKIGLSLYDHTN